MIAILWNELGQVCKVVAPVVGGLVPENSEMEKEICSYYGRGVRLRRNW